MSTPSTAAVPDAPAISAAASAPDAALPVAPAGPPLRSRLGGAISTLLVLALLYTAWAASGLLVPIVLAMAIALITHPLVRLLERLWIPAWLGAAGVLAGGLATLVLLASVLLQPAAEWLGRAPKEIRQHAPKLRELTKPFEDANRAASESLSQITGGKAARAVEQAAPPDLWSLASGTPLMLATLAGILLLAYFFLLYGGELQRRTIQNMPTRVQQRVTVQILRAIEAEVTRYVLTVSLINATLGLATAGALWLIGLEPRDALLWGVVAGLLNFAPYVGPVIGVVVLAMVGMVAFNDLGQALLVPAAWLVLSSLEGQVLTPMILGRQLSLSPLVIMLWLLLWGWLWGIAGVLLAVPMLVCLRIVAARIEGWQGWAAVIGR